ncbi:MAG: VWA domain-containing protein [Candidatus Brocadiia bacterium]
MPALHLQRPIVLLALAALPPTAILWWLAVRRAREAARTFGSDISPARTNLLRGGLRVGALALLIVALAGPALLDRAALGPFGVPLVFVLDVSASMGASDVSPDRLGAGRDAVRRIAALLPDSPTALIASAGDAVVVCPLTQDRGAFLALLERARTDWMGYRGSRPGTGMAAAAEMIGREGTAAAVVLVSDGEIHEESEEPDAASVRKAGGLLHTTTVGSEEGAVLPPTPGRGDVVTRAHPDSMARWAAEGGGAAWRITPDTTDLPGSADRLVPRSLRAASARDRGHGTDLSWLACLLAAVLLLTDRLLA